MMEGQITDVYQYLDGTALLEIGGEVTIRVRKVPPAFAAAVLGINVMEKDGVILVNGREWARQVKGHKMYALIRCSR
jgi:hypothetical protein